MCTARTSGITPAGARGRRRRGQRKGGELFWHRANKVTPARATRRQQEREEEGDVGREPGESCFSKTDLMSFVIFLPIYLLNFVYPLPGLSLSLPPKKHLPFLLACCRSDAGRPEIKQQDAGRQLQVPEPTGDFSIFNIHPGPGLSFLPFFALWIQFCFPTSFHKYLNCPVAFPSLFFFFFMTPQPSPFLLWAFFRFSPFPIISPIFFCVCVGL